MDDGIPMRMTPNYSASLYSMFCEIQYITVGAVSLAM